MSVQSQSFSKEGTTSTQVQKLWLEWMKDKFPDLDSRSYFVPPVCRMPMTGHSTAGQNVVLSKTSPTTAVNNVCEGDAAMQRVLFCLNALAQRQEEVLVGLSNLHLDPSVERGFYPPKAVEPSSFKSKETKHLVVDILLIPRSHGLVVCVVKAVATSTHEKKLIEEDIRLKLKKAIKQLEQSEAMLSHLVSDITGGLRISKAIAVPDITSGQLQRLISADSQLLQDLCRCLGTSDPADIASLCLCSDQLFDPRVTGDVNDNILRKLGNWWQRHVAMSGNDISMNRELYMKLVARFYEQVKAASPTRLCIKTHITGQITQKTPRGLFVHNPPDTDYDFSIQQVEVEVSVQLPQLPKRDEAASPSKRDKIGKRAGSDKEDSSVKSTRSEGGGGRVKIYLHAVTDVQADLLKNTGYTQPLQEVKKKTGADLQFDSNQTFVPGMKILRISGVPKQIEAALRLINQMTGVKETISSQAETFWLQWVEAAFPDLDSRAYFLPPVYFNRVPMTRQSIAGQDILVLPAAPKNVGQSNQQAITVTETIFTSGRVQEKDTRNDAALERVDGQDVIKTEHEQTSRTRQPIQRSFAFPTPPTVLDSDIRDDSAFQRVLTCLQKLSEENREVLVGLSQLQFGQYLGEPCYAAAAAHLPLPSNLPQARPRNWKQGDFDVLLIHRHYGFVICEVKAFGHNVKVMNMSQQDIDSNIKKKLREAILQLDKAEAMLSHLVSDIRSGLHITKAIAVPNLTAQQVQKAISCETELIQDLCRCLVTTDPADIAGLCLCCDQLSDPKTPCDVSSHVLRELGHWWQRRVAGAGPDSHMTDHIYKKLVARFCGPATTVTVPCTCPPRVSVKTLGQAVWWTGECYTAVITLFPEQVHLLHHPPDRLFVTGPPGTGKTVVLLLMAIQWLRCGHHVYVVSTWIGSRAACSMLYHLLLQTVKTQQSAGVSPGQPHLLQYRLNGDKDVEKAVNDLSRLAREESLYVIADEAGLEYMTIFKTFCEKLLEHIPRLHLWAASYFHGDAPAGWQVEYLTRPLRSPPAVVREVKRDSKISDYRDVRPYSERGVPDYTDGPTITRLYHRREGHSSSRPEDCVTCGFEVASFLHSLRVGVTENITINNYTTSPFLQWRDVLVLSGYKVGHMSGIVKGLEESGIPVRVMTDDDIDDVATARSDVVWVADGYSVRGLERKVVVCLDRMSTVRLHLLSRCTSQLVTICPDD